MSFIHLHTHSEYSLLDGMCRIDELVDLAKRNQMPAVALTDHGVLYGAFKFYLKAKKAGIKPIVGVEIYKAKKSRYDKEVDERKNYHLVLLAKNLEGYKNLIKIVTDAHLEGFYYKPRTDFSVLEKYSQGLIVLSGCLQSEIASLLSENQINQAEEILKKYLNIFERNFYLEIQRHPQIKNQEKINQELIRLSRRYAVPLVATNDVHYPYKEDAYAQEILLCIQTQRVIFEKNRPLSMIDIPDFYFKNQKEMIGEFIDLPEAIENTVKIAEQCNLEIPYGRWILPKYQTPNNEKVDVYLRNLVYQKIDRVTKNYDSSLIKKRIEYELEIIIKKGYSTYFLIVQDFVNWAKKNKIAVGPGRGSVAGSLVAYILGITDINPLDYNLPFERFLNPDRPTPPDIDVDFADTRRDAVLDYVTKKYGEDKVAQIITFGKMEARLVVRDVARALGLSYSQGDRIAKMIPPSRQGFPMTIAQALEESAQLKMAYQTEEETKKVLDIGRRLEGLPRHSSVHAAGIVISDQSLTEYIPLQRDPKNNKIITQYDMYCLDLNAVSDNEAIGLLKMDFLGLRNLTIIEETLNYVKRNTGQEIDIHQIPLNDKKTFNLIAEGNTIGVFQLESSGMRHLAKELKPSKISDIMAMVALYRPGPMELIPSFIEGKKDARKIKYLHPDLKPILSETYGVLVYQEQVMEIAHRLAGYTMSEADNLRMAMGKKKKELMKKEKEKFIQGCIKNGYKKSLAEKIFNFIEKFAAYGFNKPHSASYGLIAYWTAYLKANYPVEFMTTLLSAELKGVAGPNREIKMSQIIEECRRMNISVLPPDINFSFSDFTIEGNNIRFGLSAIKNVGQAAIESILTARKDGFFKSFKDFLYRVDLQKVNKKTVESLIKANAFSSFGNRATLLAVYPKIVKEVIALKDSYQKNQYGLFSSNEAPKLVDDFSSLTDFNEEEIFLMEKEIIGFSLTRNPLHRFNNLFKDKVSKKIGEISDQDDGKELILAGIISAKKVIKTRKDNSEMAFIKIFDDTGSIEVTVFPKKYKLFKDILNINNLIILKGKINQKLGEFNVILEAAKKI